MFEISKVKKKSRIWWCRRISSFKSTFLQTLKIISNCCLPAFLREVLVNYASSIICTSLNNSTIFWKQWEFLHGLNNLKKLVSVGAIHRFLFSFDSIVVIIPVNSIIGFTKQPSAEGYLANIFSPAKDSKLSKVVDIKTLRHKYNLMKLDSFIDIFQVWNK